MHRRHGRLDPHSHPASALGDGITQIRLPMRGNPLRYVNAYAVEDDAGLILIDCGWNASDVLETLRAALRAFGAGIADVRNLVVTHFHADHYGLAGTLRRHGARGLSMHAADWRIAEFILLDPSRAERIANAWLGRHGFEVTVEAEDASDHRRSEFSPPTSFLEDGCRVGRLTAVWTPGHSPGHVCFYDERTNRLFSGDHVLDPITPHVGMWFEDRGDPLGDYLESLRKVAQRRPSCVLPAHGEPFEDLAPRARELLAHHEARSGRILKALASGPRSAAEVAHALTWTRGGLPFETLTEAHRQFAVAETIAHLEHTRACGLVVRDDRATPLLYALRS